LLMLQNVLSNVLKKTKKMVLWQKEKTYDKSTDSC